MKATFMSLLTSLFLYSNTVNSQCLQNGDFAINCGSNQCNTVCFSICPDCVPGWGRSHGSPQIFPNNNNPLLAMMYMWSGSSVGEGVFADYNFVANNPYIIKIKVSVTSANNNTGSFKLFGATGIPVVPVYQCGDAILNAQHSQLIVENSEKNLGWKIYQYTYIPNDNYDKFWIYPFSTAYQQMNLYVDYVFICPAPCFSTVIYNRGVVPSGLTKAGFIYAGSSAGVFGFGTVTVVPDQITTLIGSQEIQLLSSFTATVTTGEFIAKIVQPCDPSNTFTNEVREDIDINQFPPEEPIILLEDPRKKWNKDDSEEHDNKFTIYPNPSKGHIAIQLEVSRGETVFIEIYEGTGRLILQKKESLYNNKPIQLDLSAYMAGYYFIKVIGKNFIKSGKVFVQ